MENDNSNTNKAILVVVCLMVVVAIFLAGYIIYAMKDNKEPNSNGNDNNEKENSLVGNYVVDLDGEKNYLYLREDNVFRVTSSETVANVVGTYSVDNNKLSLSGEVKYGDDDKGCVLCYYLNEDLKDIEFTIKGDKLVYEYDGKDYLAEKSNSIVDTKEDKAWFILDPVDGESPEGFTDTWDGIGWDKCDDAKDDYYDYRSVFKESSNLVIDYDIKTKVKNISFKTIYDLVVNESSKLKKSSNVNLFNYVGRINTVGEKYAYVNYDVNFYNLPKDIYSKNKKQIEEDKIIKLQTCLQDECKMNITKGYENISKYLSKSAFFYYILKDGKKVETRSILSKDYVTENIPDEWLKLGNYKTKDAMFKDVLLMTDESHTYNNYLVIYDTGSELKFKYKGKSKTVLDTSKYDDIDKLYD